MPRHRPKTVFRILFLLENNTHNTLFFFLFSVYTNLIRWLNRKEFSRVIITAQFLPISSFFLLLSTKIRSKWNRSNLTGTRFSTNLSLSFSLLLFPKLHSVYRAEVQCLRNQASNKLVSTISFPMGVQRERRRKTDWKKGGWIRGARVDRPRNTNVSCFWRCFAKVLVPTAKIESNTRTQQHSWAYARGGGKSRERERVESTSRSLCGSILRTR